LYHSKFLTVLFLYGQYPEIQYPESITRIWRAICKPTTKMNIRCASKRVTPYQKMPVYV